jgi:hypothetical protein
VPLACFILIFGLLPSLAFAQLKWTQPSKDFVRLTTDLKTEVEFEFSNPGTTHAKIVDIKSSCGCTTPELQKREYAPGEKGSLRATFVFGGRTGQQRKVITVRTADGLVQLLELNVAIAKPIHAEPGLVFWRVGDVPDAKRVTLKVPDGIVARATKATSNNPRISVRLETAPDATQVLSISPADTSKRESAELTVETNFPPDAPKSLTVFVRIK